MSEPSPPSDLRTGRVLLGGLLITLAITAAVALFAVAFRYGGGFDNDNVPSATSPKLVEVRPDTDYFLYLSRSAPDLDAGGCTVRDGASREPLGISPADGPVRKLGGSVRVDVRGTFRTDSGSVTVACDEYAGLGPAFDPATSRLLDGATLVVPLLLAAAGAWLLRGGRRRRG